MKLPLLTLCCALFVAGVLAQSDNRPRPDGFRGLMLNQTTAKEAIDILGQSVPINLTVSTFQRLVNGLIQNTRRRSLGTSLSKRSAISEPSGFHFSTTS